MKEDGKGGFKQEKEFDIIQHSQSHFEGVKGVLMSKKGSEKSHKALQSFANAGGTSHLKTFDEDSDQSSSDDMSVIEFNPPAENEWKGSNQFERWIVIEGAKSQDENK